MTEIYKGRPLTNEERNQLDDIINLLADHYGIARQIFFQKDRETRYVFARAVYVLWADCHTDLKGVQITGYINKNHAMFSYYKHLYEKDYSFKNAYDEFKQKYEHMKSITDLIKIKFKNYPELIEKFGYLEKLIEKRFTTVIYRNQHLNMLKHQISNFKTAQFDASMIDLYAWGENFINEYYGGDPLVNLEFESKGIGNGKNS